MTNHNGLLGEPERKQYQDLPVVCHSDYLLHEITPYGAISLSWRYCEMAAAALLNLRGLSAQSSRSCRAISGGVLKQVYHPCFNDVDDGSGHIDAIPPLPPVGMNVETYLEGYNCWRH